MNMIKGDTKLSFIEIGEDSDLIKDIKTEKNSSLSLKQIKDKTGKNN